MTSSLQESCDGSFIPTPLIKTCSPGACAHSGVAHVRRASPPPPISVDFCPPAAQIGADKTQLCLRDSSMFSPKSPKSLSKYVFSGEQICMVECGCGPDCACGRNCASQPKVGLRLEISLCLTHIHPCIRSLKHPK